MPAIGVGFAVVEVRAGGRGQVSARGEAPDAQAVFASYAGTLGLDVERFKTDSQSDAIKAKVDADQKRGTSIGVQNTPTIFLNNKAVSPTDLAPDRLRLVVAQAVKGSGMPSSSPGEAKK